MPGFSPLHQLARRTPAPLDGLVEMFASTVDDFVEVATNGLGGNGVEDWDPEYIRRTLPLLRTTFRNYFRGEVRGLENIPREGASLLVGNHSGGTLIADTFVLAFEFYDRFGPERRFHQLAHDVAVSMPGLGTIRRYGTVAASHENARRAFDLGAPVLVYPGGDYETYRPSWQSDQIEFGGRQGFVRLALEAGVPIVPVVAIGGQETALFLTRGRRLAKLTRLDRLVRIKVLPVQIAPPYGVTILDLPARIPLPAKITVRVLPPIDVRARFGADPEPDDVYDAVTGAMQRTLDRLSEERTVPVVG
jgi:1-acyl-sn-glycerol-3-phosphate acyltransferase